VRSVKVKGRANCRNILVWSAMRLQPNGGLAQQNGKYVCRNTFPSLYKHVSYPAKCPKILSRNRTEIEATLFRNQRAQIDICTSGSIDCLRHQRNQFRNNNKRPCSGGRSKLPRITSNGDCNGFFFPGHIFSPDIQAC